MRIVLGWMLLLVACGSEPATPDAAIDARAPRCDPPQRLAEGDAEGHTDPLGAPMGEARAGRLRPHQLPDDPEGLLPWRAGDFVLANDRVALVIEDARVSDGFDPHGGHPVGVASVSEGRLTAPADFGELVFTLERATIAPRSVTVLRDGSEGGPAVVRALGAIEDLGFIEFLRGLLVDHPPLAELAFDYELAPGDEHVTVRAQLVSTSTSDAIVRRPLLLAFQQNRMPAFAPARGFGLEPGASIPYVAFVEDGATSYAVQSDGAPMSLFVEQSNILIVQMPRLSVGACGISERTLARIAIGGPGIDGVLGAMARRDGRALLEIRGTVRTAGGSAAAGARVHASALDGTYLTRASTAEDGSFALHVPDASVELQAFRRGDGLAPALRIDAPASDVALSLGPSGELSVRVRDAEGRAIPAMVQAIPLEGAPPELPATFGEARIVAGRSAVIYASEGSADTSLPIGRHRVVASRGYEHELASSEIDVRAGERTTLDVVLEHVVPTPGIMCGDFHVHTSRSFDAPDDARLKVRASAAAGLEIPVRSEHEWVADFEPLIDELGLGEHLYGIGSLELTTFTYGHAGVFPLDADRDMRNAGAIEWIGLDPRTVFGEAQARTGRHGHAEVILNHPRAGFALLGYFDAVGYDPTTGTAARSALFWDDFTLVEVFNDSDFDANERTTVRDWFSFLNAGRRVFAVGSSDSHELARSPIGYPRTCIDVGVDTAPELRALGAGHVRDRMLAGAFTISGGIAVEAQARGGVGPGGTLEGAAERELVDVLVRAPSWVTVDRLRVYVDGALVETIDVSESSDPLEPSVRFRAAIEVPLSAVSWMVVVADGEGDLAPVDPGRRPFGVTNPIFFRR